MDDLASLQGEDDEDIQNPEPAGEEDEEVTGPSFVEAIANEGGPPLASLAIHANRAVFGDSARRNAVPELGELRSDDLLTCGGEKVVRQGIKPCPPRGYRKRELRFCGDIVRADHETGVVLAILIALIGALRALVRPRAGLVLENLALRQQLAILTRKVARPQLRPTDRAFWVMLSRVWSRWVDALIIVKPATVVSWHRRGFARFWAQKSRRIGRPPLDAEIVALIERMSRENPLWSRRRIASELAKLGHDVEKDTVSRYMPKPPRRPGQPPSTTWRAFVRAHLQGTIAIDFLVVPTVTFRLLYVFFVLSLERRKLLHLNVTSHPHQNWTAKQVVEAVGGETGVIRLIRDRDAIYGAAFDSRVNHLGLRQSKIAPRSPWQNGYAERFVGTLRREVLDNVVILGERHLLHLVRSHATYYNEDRPHMSLDRDAPISRDVELPTSGHIVAFPRVAGLHHRYARAA